MTAANAWDYAAKLRIYRSSPCGTYSGLLEPGVNFFVLMLEQLGARTEYSCEGHPDGFYVVFAAAMPIARKIHACGYFNVEIERNGRWSLRLRNGIDEHERQLILRGAANNWEKNLGCLDRRRAKQAHNRTKRLAVT